ncbi:MAG: hypothetical protein ABJF10_01680 [Chthoniobacter sp.]|uniref:hypothetical protein n=1 Tax=Chthoniobacter sp. TaxID=2510640 RepID=UPI0032A6AA95
MTTRLLLCFLLLIARFAQGDEAVPKRPTQAAPASTAITKGQRIFAAHHSYFIQVPPILTEIATAGGFPDQVIVGTKYIGGSKALYHWNVKDEDNKAKEALKAGAVDVLILTPVYLPDDGIEKFARLGFENNPNIRVTVQEFWLPYDEYQPHYFDPPGIPKPTQVDHNAPTGATLRAMHERYFQEMDALISGLKKDLGKQVVYVVPAGQAVIALREKIIAGQAPGLKAQSDLFTDPLGHPKLPLQVLISYVHYAVIYRKSPVGLPIPEALRKVKREPAEMEALNRLLQEVAWDAVIHHPLSGVKAP